MITRKLFIGAVMSRTIGPDLTKFPALSRSIPLDMGFPGNQTPGEAGGSWPKKCTVLCGSVAMVGLLVRCSIEATYIT